MLYYQVVGGERFSSLVKKAFIMKYGIKAALLFWFIVFLLCTSFESEAHNLNKAAITAHWALVNNPEHPVTIKNNKALCSLQDVNGQHIKKVLADVNETTSYDGVEYVLIEYVVSLEDDLKVDNVKCETSHE